ncbi:hypothetical protein FRC07_008932, partial [Ceratobasidium sp. 392]
MYARAARREAKALPLLAEAKTRGFFIDDRLTGPYCRKRLRTPTGRNRHIILRPYCRARHERFVSSEKERKQKQKLSEEIPVSGPTKNKPATKPSQTKDIPVAGPSHLPVSEHCPVGLLMEEDTIQSAGDGSWVEEFPIKMAGAAIGSQRRTEQDLQEYMELCRRLRDPELFETAKILMTTGLSGRGRTIHLKGPMYKWKGKGKAVWNNNTDLLNNIDKLPNGPDWTTGEVTVGEGQYKQTHTVHFRNVLELILHLVGARRFKWCMRFAPVRRWTSQDQKCQIYDEMWTGDWWWQMQYLIRNKNGTVVPLIIATDKTALTNNANGPKEYLVYLSIGNISKLDRRRPTNRAMLIIRYLPVDTFEEVVNENTRLWYCAELLHRSLEKIFEPLKEASENGMLAWCADGNLRHIFPVIAAWVADWPEQNDIACTTQGGCPRCQHGWHRRGDGGPKAPPRDQDDDLDAIWMYKDARPAALTPLHLKPCVPFWADIPHVKMWSTFTPDLLHQLYKGMFEHARNWVEEMLGMKGFNRRFKMMLQAKDLRWFKKGVTTVKLWAGRESRDMMQQLLPVAIDAQALLEFVRLIRALFDFLYLAHGAQLTDTDLSEMDSALVAFHEAKGVLVAKGIRKNFDRLAKLHMLGHYAESIRELGVPDGYSTKTPEYLHIVYVKIPGRALNKRDPVPQMGTLIDELYGECPGANKEEIDRYCDLDQRYLAEELSEDPNDSESESDIGKSESRSGGEDNDSEEMVRVGSKGESELHYPRPHISIAKQPTIPNVSGRTLITSYGASDLIRAVHRFLLTKTRPLGRRSIVLPTDHFNVWHKATLSHLAPAFAPNEAGHRDVIRIRPTVRDSNGRIKEKAAFDTALFVTNRNGHSLS